MLSVGITRFQNEERATCTSLDVAETFGKSHKHVLRDIRTLGCSEEFNRSNFGLLESASSHQLEVVFCLLSGFLPNNID